MLNDLSEIVAINSVEAPASAQDAPFGENLRRALDWFLNKSSEYGLKVGEHHGYYGYAEYGDPDKPIIGILCHIDVVPAGDWGDEAFKMETMSGKIYGRGVADDKGPLVVMLHILKKLKEDKAELRHRIRLIVGCNEETGSLCLKKYAEVGEIPIVSLVPDSDFPVINSEKGILHTDAIIPLDDFLRSSVSDLSAGERANVVPSSAVLKLKPGSEIAKRLYRLDPELTYKIFYAPSVAARLIEISAKPEDMSVEKTEDAIKITAVGTAGHAMAPERADNALWKIFAFLRAVASDNEFVACIFDKFCRPDAAKEIGVYKEDEQSGCVTMNMGVASLEGNNLTLKFDFRLPVSANPDETEQGLNAALPRGAVIKRARFADNLYIPTDSPLIKTLLKVYAAATGEKNPKPIQTGGGTYARELPNAVAFGPTFEGTETNIHNTDENMEVAHLYKLYDIYLKAVEALDKLY